jgi:hypothetical protein
MATQSKPKNKFTLWTGRILSGLCILFLLVDSIMKIVRASPSVEGTVGLGFSDGLTRPLGIIILIFTILYIIPRTSVFGAMLLTAHLGGAAAIFIQKFQGHPGFLFPVVFCVVLWVGLYLRNEQLRAVVPMQKIE